MIYPMKHNEFVGFVSGGLLYPLELVLIKVFNESPATEIEVCRKRRREAFAE